MWYCLRISRISRYCLRISRYFLGRGECGADILTQDFGRLTTPNIIVYIYIYSLCMYFFITNIVTPKACSAQPPCLYLSFFLWAVLLLIALHYLLQVLQKVLSDVTKH